MSYQVIARRWRPQSFDEVTGQSHVTTPLRNAIRTGRVPHAILLTGPRGVGKTTLARIVARCLNCEKGPTDSPCGACASCREIAAGNSTDVREIDAASRTGVDDVREVIESIRYAASPGKHRIFVIDEVHMLSTAAFNALLKTLEEPPPNSLFVFATTNPEKIPFTVLSRCQRYDLRLFSNAEVVDRLREICKAEGIDVSESSLRAVAREGQGSMRDSQTLLDQLVAYGGTTVSDETVASLLDLVDRHVLLEILGACVAGDPARALEGCHRAAQTGIEPARLAGSLVALLRDLVVLRIAPDAPDLVEGGEAELDALREVASGCEPMRLRRMFKVLAEEQARLASAPQPFAVLEMALVRLATLPPGDDVATLLSRLDELERRLAQGDAGPPRGGDPGGSGTPPAGATGGGGGSGVARRSGGSRGRKAAPADEPDRRDETPPPGAAPRPPAHAPDGPSSEAAAVGPATRPAAHDSAGGTPTPAGDAPLAVVMDRLRVFVEKHDRGLCMSLAEATLVERRDGSLTFAVGAGFHRQRLIDRSAELAALCSRFFGTPTQVGVEASTTPRDAEPDRPGAPSRREQERRRRQEALRHPKVNIALEALQGEIVEIRPIGGD